MTRKELAKEIFRVSYLRGEFLLRSGKISNEYFDKYKFESNPTLLYNIAKYLKEFISDSTEVLAGLEMGGIPLATALSLQTGLPLVFVRKKAKEYGTRKIAEGSEVYGRRVLIVEDVITSGGQVVLSADDLRASGAIISNAICVIDRESGGTEALEKVGIKLQSLFKMSELKELSK